MTKRKLIEAYIELNSLLATLRDARSQFDTFLKTVDEKDIEWWICKLRNSLEIIKENMGEYFNHP